MENKKSIGIILLGLFLAWGIINTIYKIFFKVDSLDMFVFDYYNLVWLSYILILVLLISNIASLVAIFTRKQWGLKILYSFFMLNVVFTVFTTILVFVNFGMFREFYMQMGADKGLTTENIDSVINPSMTIITTMLYVVFYFLLTFYVYKKRDYFSKQ